MGIGMPRDRLERLFRLCGLGNIQYRTALDRETRAGPARVRREVPAGHCRRGQHPQGLQDSWAPCRRTMGDPSWRWRLCMILDDKPEAGHHVWLGSGWSTTGPWFRRLAAQERLFVEINATTAISREGTS